MPPEKGDYLTQSPDSVRQTSGTLFNAAYSNETALLPSLAMRAPMVPEGFPALTIDHGNFDQTIKSLTKIKNQLYQSDPENHGIYALTNFRDLYLVGPSTAASDLFRGDWAAVGEDLSAPFKKKFTELKRLFKKLEDWL